MILLQSVVDGYRNTTMFGWPELSTAAWRPSIMNLRLIHLHSGYSIGLTSMDNRPHLALSLVTLIAGALLSLGFKEIYPDLVSRFSRRGNPFVTAVDAANLANPNKNTSEVTPANLSFIADRGVQDNKLDAIVEGIEGCIGSTVLLRIKSLSNETGCEILAKAEVYAQI